MWGRSRYDDDGYDRDGYDHSLLLLFGRCYVLLLRATAGREETPFASNTTYPQHSWGVASDQQAQASGGSALILQCPISATSAHGIVDGPLTPLASAVLSTITIASS